VSLKGKHIFVVEDDPINLAVISSILRSLAATVTVDLWGGTATKTLVKAMPIDVLLLDLMLPNNLSGYDVFDQIRAVPELQDFPIVAVTALDPGIGMNKAREKGFKGYITKPIRANTFGQYIMAILEGKEVWAELV
jgi:CheY-like chemotaxis protein